jgi:hypothetical protein
VTTEKEQGLACKLSEDNKDVVHTWISCYVSESLNTQTTRQVKCRQISKTAVRIGLVR